MNADDEALLAGWIAEALAALEAGREVDLDALCQARPEFASEVAAVLGLRDRAVLLHRHQHEAPTSTPAPLLGGRYRVLSPIGSGAAGAVYQARDERLERDVAIKLLHHGLFAGADTEARFRREALALAAHEHRHIVRVHDQGHTDDGATFLVTELLRGHSLQQVLQAAQAAMPHGPSTARFVQLDWLHTLLPQAALQPSWLLQVVHWVQQLGEGLAAAHAHGICHRDVKPSNAFVREHGSAVLLDFGIAARAGDASITHTHTVLGTPCYMAPEQAAGRRDANPQLDVYGHAATLYHLLTLRPPHDGDLQQVLLALRRDDPIPAAKLCPGLPRDLAAILDKGLERDLRRRYPTMRALLEDLDAFVQHAPVSARPIGAVRRALRRVARRPARAIAIAASIAALGFAAIGLPSWRMLETAAAERARDLRLAQLPADLCIEGYPDQRPLVPIAEQRGLIAELDHLLDGPSASTSPLDGEARDLGLYLLRAASRLDLGERQRAVDDLQRIATAADSDYVRALVERYARAAAGAHGRAVLDLDGLPQPTTATDCFLAGFHALRSRDCDRAEQLLARAGDYLPAQDLRLLALLGKRPPDAQLAIREASRLEGVYGQATARTQHTLAAAHLQLGRYRDAIPFCERALQLRPERHGPWTNLGFAHLKLGQFDAALHCYQHAVSLRPWLPNSRSGLCQTLRELGRYGEAREVAAAIEDVGWREYELGNLELQRALQALSAHDTATCQAAADAAALHFGAAREVAETDNPKAASVRASQLLAERLSARDLTKALAPMLLTLRGAPSDARQIANLAALLEHAQIDDDARGRLRLWLFDLAIELRPDDAEYRRRRSELIDKLQRR